MHRRKIDDRELLQMAQSGMLQKDMAAHFGVTVQAVSKRLKRLQLPESMNVLSEKERAFALAISEGKNQTAAAAESYNCTSVASAKAIGHQLMKKDSVQLAIKDLMDQEGLERRYRVQRLRQHVDNRDPNVSLKALDQSWKLDGSYAPERHVSVEVNTYDLDPEVREFLRKSAAQLRQLMVERAHAHRDSERETIDYSQEGEPDKLPGV